MPLSSDNTARGAFLRAAERSAAAVHLRMKRGTGSLATIASVAPLLGFLITLEGIVGSFHGVDGERSTIMAWLAESLSYAIARCAPGLLAGILAFVCYRYLRAKLEEFDVEIKNAILEVANTLP